MHIITWYNGVKIHRADKIIYGQFLQPHLVLSTCRAGGGMVQGLEYVLNHQSCEPCNHHRGAIHRDSAQYRAMICKPYGLAPEKCATMGTAANMNHAAFVSRSFRDLTVSAVITGGVETNAGRAGDPASVYETVDGFESLDGQGQVREPKPGTINIMLFISHPLTPAALTRTIMMATEAKTAALQELAVNSRYSNGLATGTGTDQIIVSAPDRDGFRLGWAGKHGKLGELIGRTVMAGVKKTLARQNSLTPRGQASAKLHLERFGCTTATMLEGIAGFLIPEQAALFCNNYRGIFRDPLTVAAVAAMVHLRDKFSWGVLPDSCWKEVMAAAAAQVACSISLRYEQMARYRDILGRAAKAQGDELFLALCWQAMALGFIDKWPEIGAEFRGDEK
ncbi:MAG TPA: adenosylcobinamide amidohydrolase [Desulfobulbus sp.]|nr:adenosylcobinamide amidohydrolase [Desulfobulbus sp.]